MQGERACVVWQQCGVHVGHQHLPSSHAGIAFLVGVQRVVPFCAVGAVVGHQLLPCEVFAIFVRVVPFIAHLLVFLPPLTLAVETADARVVLVYDAAFLGSVQRLGVLLLRVLRGAEVYEWEYFACPQKSVAVLAHQVVFHLDAGRYAPSVASYGAEHVAETLHHEALVFLSAVAGTQHALAHHVVGVVCVYALLGVFQLAREVHVVHRYLRERELSVMAVHVGHLLVHERGIGG